MREIPLSGRHILLNPLRELKIGFFVCYSALIAKPVFLRHTNSSISIREYLLLNLMSHNSSVATSCCVCWQIGMFGRHLGDGIQLSYADKCWQMTLIDIEAFELLTRKSKY